MIRLHHVQMSIPRGGEALARRFWVQGFGLAEVAKPVALATRGGCWFRSGESGDPAGAEIHVGVEEPFAPARRAHPALLVESRELEALASRLGELGFDVDHTDRETFVGYLRFHCTDAHGNRIEVLAAQQE